MINRRKGFARLSGLALATLMLLSIQVQAGDSFIQLALFNPVQLVGEDQSITGIRLNIYGKNASLKGLDWGFVHHLTDKSLGVQFGLVGYCESDFGGWQDNWINITKGEFQGVQTGLFNSAGDGLGLQWGFVNHAKYMNGLMLGFVNYAESMKGIQIGLVNIIRQGGVFPVLPIINFSF